MPDFGFRVIVGGGGDSADDGFHVTQIKLSRRNHVMQGVLKRHEQLGERKGGYLKRQRSISV